jgi:hypothetical protein
MMRRPVPIFLIILFTFTHFLTQAQTRQDFSGWAALFGTYKFDSKFGMHFEGQLRSTSGWQELQTYIIRLGINYNVKANMMTTLGYAYIGHYRTIMQISGWGPEHRIWEQFLVNNNFSLSGHASSIVNRFRLEQRFISQSTVDNSNNLVSGNYQFMQRFRYFARWIFPLQKSAKFIRGPYLSLQDEAFFNIQNADVTNGYFFDQNRAYFSAGFRTSARFDIEAGYMNQFILGRTTNTMNNIIQLATYLRL